METGEEEREYVYLPLVDALKTVGSKVNLFAVIVQIGNPKRSRGTDFVLTLKIIDQSYTAPGIPVNFFAENPTKLPCVRLIGDIISLHHVVIRIHGGGFYCLYDKRFSSFALFSRKTIADLKPYQISTKYGESDHDNEHLSQLRTWLVDQPPDADGCVVSKEYELQLKSIRSGYVCDLVCKVLHVCKTSSGEWILFVWDGTDTPPASLEMDLDAEGKTPMPLHLEEYSLSRGILCTFPSVGTVLRIFTNSFFKERTNLEGGRDWVRLCNITCELQYGIWKGVLQTSSKVRLLSNEDCSVMSCLKAYQERITSKVGRQPFTSFPWPSHALEVDNAHAAYATLMDSLIHKEVTHTFKCIVRVVAAYPWRAADMVSPRKGHNHVRLTLEDPTARIHAYICKEDGVKFFGSNPASDILTRKMNRLLGIAEVGDGVVRVPDCDSRRDPPWVWCCLKSYYVDKNDPWGSRKYRIFGTKLLG
ncbi:protection of telomeres protein 1a-like [Typha angustifolia]|uniref:protection of telomeres protein 1a-like n=1 Tax=Typha angustifolia TaxID=59011 RepID=UPI003C2C07B1